VLTKGSEKTRNGKARLVWRGSFFLLLNTLLAGLLNYLTGILLARTTLLGPEDFGAYMALLALMTFWNSAAVAQMIVLTRTSAQLAEDGRALRQLWQGELRRATWFGALAAALLWACLPLWRWWLTTPPSPLFILGIIILFQFHVMVNLGLLRGMLAFSQVAEANILGAAVRFVAALWFVRAGMGIAGALGGNLLGWLATLLLSALWLRRRIGLLLFHKGRKGYPKQKSQLPIFPVSLGVLTLTAFSGLDVFWSRVFLTPHAAGVYAGLALLARAVYFLALPFAEVMYPLEARNFSSWRRINRATLITSGTIALIGIVAVGGSLVLAKPIVLVTIGKAYVEGASWLFLFALVAVFLAFAAWLWRYLLARGEAKISFFLPLFLLLETFLILWFHKTIAQIAFVTVVSTASMVLLLGIRTAQISASGNKSAKRDQAKS
jgi:O-antigen/teichoic acid export membrane protein